MLATTLMAASKEACCIQNDRDPAEILLHVFLHHGLAASRPGAPMNVFHRITGPVLARTDELDRLASAGRERDAAGLMSSPERDNEFVHGVETRIDEQRVLR